MHSGNFRPVGKVFGVLKIPGPERFEFKVLTQLIGRHAQHISAKRVFRWCVGSIDIQMAGHAHAPAVTDDHGILSQVTVNCLAQDL